MGIRITSQEKVAALFDSVSGFAFGPTFEDEFEAQDFLDWYLANGDGKDLRYMSGPEIAKLVGDFSHSRQPA